MYSLSFQSASLVSHSVLMCHTFIPGPPYSVLHLPCCSFFISPALIKNYLWLEYPFPEHSSTFSRYLLINHRQLLPWIVCGKRMVKSVVKSMYWAHSMNCWIFSKFLLYPERGIPVLDYTGIELWFNILINSWIHQYYPAQFINVIF